MKSETITVENTIDAPVEKVWQYFTTPNHITKWNHANDEWHSPSAENDLRPNGKFNYRMEAKDGSFGFDFGGVYNDVKENEVIDFSLEDNRKVRVLFEPNGNRTRIIESFDAESQNSIELQKRVGKRSWITLKSMWNQIDNIIIE